MSETSAVVSPSVMDVMSGPKLGEIVKHSRELAADLRVEKATRVMIQGLPYFEVTVSGPIGSLMAGDIPSPNAKWAALNYVQDKYGISDAGCNPRNPIPTPIGEVSPRRGRKLTKEELYTMNSTVPKTGDRWQLVFLVA